MSLEKEIAELNITIQRLIAVLQNNAERAPVVQQVAAPEREEAAESQAPDQAADVIEVAPTFEQVQSAFVKFIAEKGRDSALELLKRYGVNGKLTEGKLPVSEHANFIADCKL